MRCYYRNGISCGANRREFEDQRVIKGKLKSNGIRPSWSLIWERRRLLREEEKEERKEEKKKKKKKGMDCYGFVWISMDCYGFVWIVMVLYGFVWILVYSISRV